MHMKPSNISSSYVAIDAFCGAGGLSLGLTRAGFDVQFAFDTNEKAIATYKKNIGAHAHVLDASSVEGQSLPLKGSVTLVAGGPPCQGFSVQRRGAREDARNDLIFEFLRLVGEVQPQLFLMENVAALASPRNRVYYQKLLKTAAMLGYSVEASILNAADFGVPQIRKRLFVLGVREDLRGKINLPTRSIEVDEWRSVRDAIQDLPDPSSAKGKLYPNHTPDNISPLNRERISHVPPGGGRSDIPEHLRLPCHSVSVEVAGHRGVYGRLDWDKPAGTITTKCNSFTRGRFAHPTENRNISMREAARLQSFPDTFVFEGGKVDVAHQIGNAVPPDLAYGIASDILKQLRRLEIGLLDTISPKTKMTKPVMGVV